MRTGTIVLAAYLLCVVVATVWMRLPTSIIRDAVPDVGALTAAYLGLTARGNVAPAVGGSVVLGYLVDLISGTPPGLAALSLPGWTWLVTALLGSTWVLSRRRRRRPITRSRARCM